MSDGNTQSGLIPPLPPISDPNTNVVGGFANSFTIFPPQPQRVQVDINVNVNDEQADKSEEVDESVFAFALEMQSRLDEVDGQPGKNGWKHDGKFFLAGKLTQKAAMIVNALEAGMSAELIRDLCADAGNYAMMIADNEGALRG